jgi:hypothetical protein
MANKNSSKPVRAKTASKSRKKKSSKTPNVSLLSLHKRVTALETRIAGLADGGDMRALDFTLEPKNAPDQFVQIRLRDTGEKIRLTIDNNKASSKPRASGQTIKVAMDCQGDDGQQATVDITNVTDATTPFVSSVLSGSSASDDAEIVTDW